MRLIDADKLKNRLITLHEAYKVCNSYPMRNKHRWYASMIEELDKQPTVEMTEDCISRQYLIERATSWDKHFADSERYVSLTDIQNAPSVTPQPCEDCVKRDDAQDIMARLLSDYLHDEDREKIENANAEIGELPSVTPRPKRGKWVEVEVRNCHATLKCSECDRVIGFTYTFGEYSYEAIKKFYPYCHCGARMDADMREVQDDGI